MAPGDARHERAIAVITAIACAVLLVISACSPGEARTPVPTQALIPATSTDTATPITPTATPQPLPGPNDIRLTPSTAGPTPSEVINRQLISRVLDDLGQSLKVDPDEIQLVGLDAMTWMTVDLGCGIQNLPGADLHIDGFRVLLKVGDTTYEYHTDKERLFRRCESGLAAQTPSSALIEIDPVAAELVALAQRRVAQELDVSARRVLLVEVVAITWPDSSLGCPLTGQTYIPAELEGYRIVLAVGDRQYTFHSDTEHLIACAPEDERLPGSEQTPEPSASSDF